MPTPLQLTVNDRPVAVEVEPQMLLVELLRGPLALYAVGWALALPGLAGGELRKDPVLAARVGRLAYHQAAVVEGQPEGSLAGLPDLLDPGPTHGSLRALAGMFVDTDEFVSEAYVLDRHPS